MIVSGERRLLLCLVLTAAVLSAAAGKNVKRAGAKGNGIADDTAAIQRAIDNTPSGQTVFFPRGIYRVTKPLTFHSGKTYQGEDGSIIKGPDGGVSAVSDYNQTFDLVIDHLGFDTAGFAIVGDKMPGINVKILNCTFQNVTTNNENWTTHTGIFVGTGIRGGVIAHNHFRNIQESDKTKIDNISTGFFAYGLDHVAFTDNDFTDVNEGVHAFFSQSYDSSNVVFARNTGTHFHRMGIELQGSKSEGVLVEENYFHDFVNPFWNTMGLSIVIDGDNGIVRRNVIVGRPEAQPKLSYGYGLEIGGRHTIVEDNVIEGFFSLGIGLGWAPNAVVQRNGACGSEANQKMEPYLKKEMPVTIGNNTKSADCQIVHQKLARSMAIASK